MNTNLSRGLLNALAIELAIAGTIGLFWALAWAWAIAAALVLVIVAGCMRWCADRPEQPPFTSRHGCVADRSGVER